MTAPAFDALAQVWPVLRQWQEQYGAIEPHPSLHANTAAMLPVLKTLVQRLADNYPFHHPSYAGQMLKPPHPIAWAAYALAMCINPNNHALDGGPPTSEMEKDVVRSIGHLFGYADPCLGHLTSSGTIANLEALWVARELQPTKAIAYGTNAHYTHARMCQVLGVQSIAVTSDAAGKLSVQALERVADSVGTVVVTMGTTGMGVVEPLADVIAFCQPRGIRVHVDAAYGGFFKLLVNEGRIEPKHWAALHHADSIVVDPHKHGLQPYGCGCVLFKDPTVGRFYKHDSPYTYFSSDQLHLGEISLECSRAGAAAAALWATLQLLPLTPAGLGAVLAAARQAALDFAGALAASTAYHLMVQPELDIVVYAPLPKGQLTSTAISTLSQRIFDLGMQAAPAQGLHLSLYKLPTAYLQTSMPTVVADATHTTVLRSVLMKPEHAAFVPQLMQRLQALHAQAT